MMFRSAAFVRWLSATWVCAALLLPAAAQTNNASAITALQSSLQSSISALDRSLVAVVAVGKGGPLVVGTGFFVANDGTFVTAFHVLQQGPGIDIAALVRVNDRERKMVAVEPVFADTDRDLALCRAVLPHGGKPVFNPVKLATVSDALPGTLVLLSGFPLTANKASSHLGIVSSQTAGAENIEIAALINDGESGAPILRMDSGEVIGMVASVRTASTYAGAGRGVEGQNSGLALGARAEWISKLMSRAQAHTESRRSSPAP